MSEARWMRRSLELARMGWGYVSPGAMVGAVIVRDGEVLAEGWHRAGGLPHAERDALSRADDVRGATMYVSLEPCCHYGRTPPCTDAIIAAGITKVVVAMVDPDPRVRGEGIAILRAAGIDVEVGLEDEAARELNGGFIKCKTRGLPQVWLKAAATLDGRIADAGGRSKWITGPEARAEGHRWRHQLDAILVGVGTLLADDPALTARPEGIEDVRHPLPVVLDSRLRCPLDARIFQGPRRPVIYCAEDAPERALPADVVRLPRTARGVDVDAALRDLARRGVQDVLVEGGAEVHRSMLDAGLADRLLLFLAPKVLAGGPGFVSGAPLALAEARGWTIREARTVGGDLLVDLQIEGG